MNLLDEAAVQDALVPPDQWERIQERVLSSRRTRGRPAGQHLRSRTPGFGFLPPRLLRQAATVTLLVGASATTTWLLIRSGPSLGENTPPETDSPLMATGATASNRQKATIFVEAYQPAITDLERLLPEGRGRLRPETIAIVEENLRVIDAAIADVEEALASDPAHPGVLRTLDGVLQAKLHLLREAVGLTRGA